MPRREEILDSRAVVPDGVMSRAFEAELLMLNLGTGTYHAVDATGARTLELLGETGGDVRLAIDRLATEHGLTADEIADDLLDFLGKLVERGLLEVEPR